MISTVMAAIPFLFQLFILEVIFVLSWGAEFTAKDFKVERMVPCKLNSQIPIAFECVVPNRPLTNQLTMSGAIVVKENITKSINLRVHITRCNMDMSYCVNYDVIVLQAICSKLAEKGSVWNNFADSFEPKLRCPLIENTFKVTNGTLDLSTPAKLPIDGFHWIIKFEFIEFSVAGLQEDDAELSVDESRLLMCLDSDITVRNSRRKRKRKDWTITPKTQNKKSFVKFF